MAKSKKLIIVGDSAFAEIAYEYFQVDSEYEVVAFSVERDYMTKNVLFGLPIVEFENLESYFNPTTHEIYVATTYSQLNRLRTRLSSSAKSKGFKLATYISSRAYIWRNVEVGEHCFIFENNILQPFVKIQNNVVLWSGNHIGHHSLIRSNCFISSQVVISGFCDVGKNSFIGVNSTLANNVSLGDDNWIGPNMLISKSTNPNSLYRIDQPEPSKISATRFFKVDK